MTLPAPLVFSLLVLLAAVTVYVLAVKVPRDLRAVYRLELWDLRDRLIDDIAFGRIRKSQPAIALINVIEHAITAADKFTALRISMLVFAYRGSPSPEFLHNGVPDVHRLRAYREELTAIRRKWLIRGSISGWLLILWLPFAGLVYAIATRKPVSTRVLDRTEIVARRVDTTGRTAMNLDRVDRRQLMHCA